MLIFGVRVVMFFRNAKWSVKIPFTRFSLSCTRTMWPGSFSTVVSFWNGSAADTVCDESTQLMPGAGQREQEILEPRAPAELAVGDDLEADAFLQPDDVDNRLVFQGLRTRNNRAAR